MSSPLVTIAVPVYNGARHLRESLDSLLGQTYPRTEVIVLDDASKDDTPAILASYGDRIRVVRNEKNLGGFGNMNAGVKLAAGELIAIYHADDVYEPMIVEREVDYLRAHPTVGAVFCLDTFIDAESHEYGRLQLPPDLARNDVLTYEDVLNALLRWKNRFLRAPGAMIRRSTYDAVGLFREQFGIASDLDMWLRIARYSGIGLLHEYLFRYRHFHGNWSQQYQYLRTEPDAFFRVVDAWLASGERAHAAPDALAAYEGQRAEEHLDERRRVLHPRRPGGRAPARARREPDGDPVGRYDQPGTHSGALGTHRRGVSASADRRPERRVSPPLLRAHGASTDVMFRAFVTIGVLQLITMLLQVVRTKTLAVLLGSEWIGVMGAVDRLLAVIAQTASLSFPFAAVRFLPRLWTTSPWNSAACSRACGTCCGLRRPSPR